MIISAVIICIILNKILVRIIVSGSSIGPPNDTRKAVTVIDRNGGRIALGENVSSKLYKVVAKKLAMKVTKITITTGIGAVAIGTSVNGMKNCSPNAFAKAKKIRLESMDMMEIRIPIHTILLGMYFCIFKILKIAVNYIPSQLFESLSFFPCWHIF